MIKVVPTNGWNFDDETIAEVPYSSRGLIGDDFRSMVKRAGTGFAELVRQAEHLPGEVWAHNIAMGSTEAYSCNRNGDGFKEASLRKYHPTFVKHAYCFRNHKNKDPRKSYGIVKASYYNSDMHRVELLLAYNGTKEAADRTGGLIADLELEDLMAKRSFDTSMACRVPVDTCSSCHNKAASRREYCEDIDEGGMCKGGGLKHNIGRYCGEADSPILHADNPDPVFFDNSRVPRGADRVAFTLGILKSAAAGDVRGGAAQADYLHLASPPMAIEDEVALRLVKLAYRVAREEALLDSANDSRLVGAVLRDHLWSAPTDGPRALHALACQGVALPFQEFTTLAVGEKVASQLLPLAAGYMPRLYRDLVTSDDFADVACYDAVAIDASEKVAAARQDQQWCLEQARAFSFDPRDVDRRAWLHIARGTKPEFCKASQEEPPTHVKAAAQKFAWYQLAVLDHATRNLSPRDVDCVLRIAVAQNRARN